MSKLILFEDEACADLHPLTSWRSVFELRLGRRTLLDELTRACGRVPGAVWTRAPLAEVVVERCRLPVNEPAGAGDVLINGRWIPEGPVTLPKGPCVGRLEGTVAFVVCDESIAGSLTASSVQDSGAFEALLAHLPEVPTSGMWRRYPWDFISDLSQRLLIEWCDEDAVICAELDPGVTLKGRDRLHVGERAIIHPTVSIDATMGPVFFDADVVIGAQSVIEGPIYLGSGTRVNPRSWLHGGNAIGPMCKVGGEIDGCIIAGFSNKQHDGFLGHVYVGSWVNIGAGTNNSDLKNTYGSVRVPMNGRDVDTGLQFYGAAIGDHAKLGINTSIPTGAVVGFAAVGATTKVLPKDLPAFSWLTDDRHERGDIEKLIGVASAVMERRQQHMTTAEASLFRHIFSQTALG